MSSERKGSSPTPLEALLLLLYILLCMCHIGERARAQHCVWGSSPRHSLVSQCWWADSVGEPRINDHNMNSAWTRLRSMNNERKRIAVRSSTFLVFSYCFIARGLDLVAAARDMLVIQACRAMTHCIGRHGRAHDVDSTRCAQPHIVHYFLLTRASNNTLCATYSC
jgi:hypothetical protein